MEQIKIHCAYDKLVDIQEIKLNPNNRNKHPDDQIIRLAKIIKAHGIRRPIIVSTRSNTVTCGHGRVMALKHLGVKHVPVNFQDYKDEAEEYSDAIADNAIASWSQLDLQAIEHDVLDFGPDFDIDLLGMKSPVIEDLEVIEEKEEDKKESKIVQCPNCGEQFDSKAQK